MVRGATKKLKNPYKIWVLKFRGAFPYPVALIILTIFSERGIF